MSVVSTNKIWQPQRVLPYLLTDLTTQIKKVSPVYSMALFGSRGRTPVHQWKQLEGKDWDVVVAANFPIANTHIWTHDLGYHIDLRILGKQNFQLFQQQHSLRWISPKMDRELTDLIHKN